MPSDAADCWIADRMRSIESSGIRKVFDLARSLKDPVNLSIGQPDFDVPAPIKTAAKEAIDRGFNGYTVTQGIPELRSKIATEVRKLYPRHDREVFLTSGTSGGSRAIDLAAIVVTTGAKAGVPAEVALEIETGVPTWLPISSSKS